jgi:pyruvate ferredoxin oxidoreductase alpha subunit
VVVIAMGTLGKEAEVAVDLLRKEGVKAVRCAAPVATSLPELDLKGRDAVVHRPRYSFGFGGVLATSLKANGAQSVYSGHRRAWRTGVTYEDIADFVRKRRMGEEFWFGVCS